MRRSGTGRAAAEPAGRPCVSAFNSVRVRARAAPSRRRIDRLGVGKAPSAAHTWWCGLSLACIGAGRPKESGGQYIIQRLMGNNQTRPGSTKSGAGGCGRPPRRPRAPARERMSQRTGLRWTFERPPVSRSRVEGASLPGPVRPLSARPNSVPTERFWRLECSSGPANRSKGSKGGGTESAAGVFCAYHPAESLSLEHSTWVT